MARNKIEIVGLNEVMSIMADFPPRFNRRILVAAYKKLSRILIRAAKRRVPKRTGNLRKSIGSFTFKGKFKSFVMVGPRKGKRSRFDGWYAHFIEFGTVKQSAKPFMRPAYDETKNDIQSKMGEEIGKAFTKFVNKKAKKIKV